MDVPKWAHRVRRLVGRADNEVTSAVGEPAVTTPPPADDTGPRYERMLGEFLAAVAGGGGTILELGSRARSGTTYRHWFPEHVSYIGLDVTAGPNVDVVGDAHHLSRYVDEPVDFVFSISTFEHFLMPWKVALEINKVLVDGGLVFSQSHQTWPLHDEPWDFFRFSKDAWRGLFNAHTGFEVVAAEYRLPGSIVSVGPEEPATFGLGTEPAYLTSGCVARKIGPAVVSWEAEAGDLYDLAYTHGTEPVASTEAVD